MCEFVFSHIKCILGELVWVCLSLLVCFFVPPEPAIANIFFIFSEFCAVVFISSFHIITTLFTSFSYLMQRIPFNSIRKTTIMHFGVFKVKHLVGLMSNIKFFLHIFWASFILKAIKVGRTWVFAAFTLWYEYVVAPIARFWVYRTVQLLILPFLNFKLFD